MKINEGRNRGGYIMSADAMDVDILLSRSRNLAGKGKEADSDK